jgi:subtilase family serine protease
MYLLSLLLCFAGFPGARAAARSGESVLQSTHAEYFGLTASEGISNVGAWSNNPTYSIVCPSETEGNYTVGPENPTLCVEGVEVLLSSSQFGNMSVSFGKDELESFRTLSVENPDEYVYGLPLSKYAAPNVFYDVPEVTFFYSGGGSAPGSLKGRIFNCFNASAASLRDYYGVDDSLQGSQDTVQGIVMSVGTGEESVNASAINEYLDLQGLVPNTPLQFSDWGPKNDVAQCFAPGADCAEQMLDTQAQQAFAPQAFTFYTPTINVVKNIDTNETAYSKVLEQHVLEFLRNTTESEMRPQVASLSWSWDYGDFISYDVLEEGLKKLALDGMTIMVASGDSGASGNDENRKCFNASNPLIGNHAIETWPTVSPWVTVVGGTQMLATDDYPEGIEVVCSTITGGGITSGGGFAGPVFPANLYGRPAWQEKAVTGFLSNNSASTFDGFPTPKAPGYNPEGRAFPDISMYGSWFPMLNPDGTLRKASGTSLSAPMAAAVFSLANQKLMEDGYGIIGYANPMLYWMGENCTEAYNDITIGNIKANKDGDDCLYGFPAVPGWDAATGFGSINFGPFVECAKRYQDEVRSKGLELLPDGTFNMAAASSSSGGSSSDQATALRPNASARGYMMLSSSLMAVFVASLPALIPEFKFFK